MTRLTRRKILEAGAATALASVLPGAGLLPALAKGGKEALVQNLVLAGPPAPPSIYLARLAQQAKLEGWASNTEFMQWRSPDMLISQVLNNQISVGATPSNVAATLYNKGAKIKLLDITTWGVLHLLTRRNDIKSFTDLKGKDLLLFFRGGMPDIITRYLALKQGLKPGEDIKITYAANPLLAMKMFMAGQVETVVLPEPAVTAVKIKSKVIAKPVHQIDMQKVWFDVTGRTRVPQAGTLVQADLVDKNPELVEAIKRGLSASVKWMNDKPDEAARLGGAQFDLPAPIVIKSLRNVHMERVSALKAREELEFFYSALMELSPKTIGGRLPDDDFYLA